MNKCQKGKRGRKFQQFEHSAHFRVFAGRAGRSIAAFIPLLALALFFGSATSPVSAETKSQTGVSVEVVNGCSVSVINSEHNAEVSAGTYVESIGDPTVFQIACNDTNKYTINAVGYSNDIEGTTELIGTSDNGNITTGTAQNGSTSNWAFHLLESSAGVTIVDTFNKPHEIPGSSTIIAKRESGFKNPGDTGFDIFKVAYSTYISTLQRAGSYKGKVKYTLFNQGIAYSYKITYDLNGGDSGPQSQAAEVMDLTVKLSTEEPKRDGYDFVTWCSKDPDEAETCSGDSYAPGANYTLPGNNATVDLYATWKKSGPTPCQNGACVIMKDNKCWSKSDVSSSFTWSDGYCKSPWRLPSQADFNTLLRAYYPSAGASGTGYYYNGSTSDFAADWGATSGTWWSSTLYSSSKAYSLYLSSIYIGSANYDPKANYNQIRCVSEV